MTALNREREERRRFCQGLHALANWLAANPNVPLPKGRLEAQVYEYGEDANERVRAIFKQVVHAAARTDKRLDDNFYRLLVSFGGGVEYEAWTSRSEVCTPRKVGTKTVPKREYVEVGTHVVPVYEYDCPPLLAPRESK